MELSPGSLVAGYRIETIVEHDRLGVVYEATQLSLNRTVALRLLPRAFAEAVAFRERVRRSARKQVRLDHPHIVSVFEFGESGHGLFIAMRLIRGPNLKELIVARELDAARTLRILTPISDALDTAHEAALIHGGINPQCILVGRRDHSLLRDFGLSIGPGEVRAADTGAFIGAIDYISPEGINGETATVKSDVYSLAAVLYECLTGIVPYPKDSDVAVLYAQVAEDPPRVSDHRPELPASLDDVIAKGMAKDPDERYASAGQLLHEANLSFHRRTRAALEPAPIVVPADIPIPHSQSQDRLLGLLREGARAGILPQRAMPPEPPPAVGEVAAPASAGTSETVLAEPEPSPAGRERPDVWAPVEAPDAPATRHALGRLPHLLALVLPLVALGAAIKWLVGCRVDVQPRRGSRDTVVDCTVFAPPVAAPGEVILVQVFAHLPLQDADARALATEFDPATTRRAFKSLEATITLGTRLEFHFSLTGSHVDEPVQTLVWRGRAEAVQFIATIAANVQQPRLIGTVTVTQNSVPIGHVKFMLGVLSEGASGPQTSQPVGDDARRYRSAFLSYASEDRVQVVRGAQMLRSVGIRCLQDILELDPGDRWERKLYSLIEQSDVFLLFWSDAAKQSEWVRKEVAHALRGRKTDLDPPEIKPIILERPPSAPWPEVAHLHFDDRLSYFIGG